MYPDFIFAAPGDVANDLDDSSVTLRILASWRCRVLVVDDDELVRAQLAGLLELAGYDVEVASSGEEALRILGKTFCQIVITDWKMSEMNGLELCRHLRLRDDEGYVYVLMLTMRDAKPDVLAGLAAGADDYVVKGASAAEILARLEVGRRITAVEHALRERSQENRRMAVTDPLTGAHNRRYLMKFLPRELERARRYDHPLAVLSCDIDGFKRINDSFGHEAGDEVLQAFVARSAGCIREATDWIARSGGEEFVLVLPETTLNGASCVAKKLCRVFAAQPIATCAGPLIATVSIGVSALETPDELASLSVTELLRAADRCLYASKRLGKDRVTAASAGCGSPILSTRLSGVKNEIH
jgi:diguanylate cyclase (GGDEF)-like protein